MTSADDPAVYARLRDRFDELVELPPTERALRLDRLCGDDSALRSRLVALLVAHEALEEKTSTLRAAPTGGHPHPGSLHPGDSELAPGTVVDRYVLVSSIGEGGFGSVFRAMQRTPVHRAVALKVLKRGMDTRLVVTRFRAEMQALASMDSPHIAKMLDAGATPDGRPYFVMELVDGAPITRFCDGERLPIRDRLELLVQVCDAIQHAHQKGVFHRDIKPGNVLAARRHGRPFATVIDFGIAKAIEPLSSPSEDGPVRSSPEPGAEPSAEFGASAPSGRAFRTVGSLTMQGQRLGTPSYMSVEQMRGESDIDARTDVHAIGVLLCELISGDTPLGWAGLANAPLPERERFLSGSDALTPSARLAGADAAARASVASRRGTSSARLVRAVRDDLDWIVARATDPDRSKRYPSASELAADLVRHLHGEPVLARPPETSYRLRKFIGRHRRGVVAVAGMALALVLGLIGTTVGLLRANAALDEARRRERETAAVAEFQGRMLAEVDADLLGARLLAEIADRYAALQLPERTAREIDGVVASAPIDTFRSSLDAVNGTDVASWLIAAAVLDPAVAALEGSTGLSPASRIQLQTSLAESYAQLGNPDAALALRRAALETSRRHFGDDDPVTLDALHAFGETLLRAGAASEAETALRDAAIGRRALLGHDDPDSVTSVARHGEALLALGRLDDAAPRIEESLGARLRRFGTDHADSIDSLSLAGALSLARGDLAAAEARHTQAADAARRLWGDESPLARSLFVSIMTRLIRQGRIAEAEPYARRALAADRSRLGDDHPETLRSRARLGAVLSTGTKLEEAEAICRDVHARTAARYGAAHPATVAALSNLARSVQLRGRLVESLPLHLRALNDGAALWDDDHPHVASLRSNAGVALIMLGRLDEAQPHLAGALAARQRSLPPGHPDTVQSILILGFVHHQRGELDAAVDLLREAVEWRRTQLSPSHPDTLDAIERLADALCDAGECAEAETLLHEALAKRRESQLDDQPSTILGTAATATVLADLLRRRSALAEALPLAEASLASRERILGVHHPATIESMLAVAQIDRDAARLDEAEARLRAALARCDARSSGPTAPHSPSPTPGLSPLMVAVELAALLVATDRHAEAETLLAERAERAWSELSPGHILRDRVVREMDTLYATWPSNAPAPADPAGASRWRERRAAGASTRS